MTPDPPVPRSEQVAAFFERRHTRLVALVFTDLVDSTALLSRLGDQAGANFLQQRRQLIRQVLAAYPEGEEIETAGDSFLLAFAKPSDAVRFALQVQARLRGFSAASALPVQERIGIHLGEVVIAEHETEAKAKDLYGIQLASCARVMALAVGGQILLTRGVFDSARQVLKGEDIPGIGPLSWVGHGPYLLKGIEEPVEVCEVGEAGARAFEPPKTSEKAQRQIRPDEEPVLGWRPAVGLEVPNTKWVLEEKLGEGGFGEVWVAQHPKLKERHVFKFCFRADRIRSLKREVTLFRLMKERVGEHPNVVRIHNVYFDQPPFYLEEEYVAGKDLKTWCEAQGGIEKVPWEVRLEIVAQAAEGLQAAHDAGIIHRDVKPGNILVSGSGGVMESSSHGLRSESTLPHSNTAALQALRVKLTDFGIGQVVSAEVLAGVTRAGFTQTILSSTSSQTGTHLYMAPELLAGKPASTRSDIYSLGVVLYQLLVGDLHRPLTTDWPRVIDDPLLREDLFRCFAGQPEERFPSADLLAKGLRSFDQRRAVLAERQASMAARQRTSARWKIIRTASIAALVLGLALSLTWVGRRNAKARWARERALPEINQLAKEGDVSAAFALARQAEHYIPHDPALANLWPHISVLAYVETTPVGADIHLKEYRKPDSAWQYLGKSPLKAIRLPRDFYRWQIKKEGYLPIERAAGSSYLANAHRYSLDAAGLIAPGMVHVEGGQTGMQLAGFDNRIQPKLEDYCIDKYEVSNRQYKEFIDRGGYDTIHYWKHPFIKQGKVLTWTEGLAEFRDATGRPGPATWKNGTYPAGEADYPVTGISWYEAAAYAEFAGKRLPSLYHWSKAATLELGEVIVPLSNFAGRGPARIGSYLGMSGWGAYDMAGNAKEWCWNEAGQGKRYILGGAWREPEYLFWVPDSQSPFDRSPTDGFRCVTLLSTNPLPKGVDDRVLPAYRDYANELPVSDEVFRSYKSFFSYDKTDMAWQIEAVDDSSEFWREEKVSFSAAYGNERVTAFLFLPKKSAPPYQAVVYFPGSHAIFERSSENIQRWRIEFVVESGRAVMYPIYKSTYERGDGLLSDRPSPTSAYRDHVIMWSKDLGRALDYLETRQEIQHDKVAYYGVSWGALLGVVLPAVESRLKANVLVAGGFLFEVAPAEVDQINFAPRVTIPTLMLNGRYDSIFPLETSQLPMFRMLGTAPQHKRHVILNSGHVPPSTQLAKEIPPWLDHYLGPVN